MAGMKKQTFGIDRPSQTHFAATGEYDLAEFAALETGMETGKVGLITRVFGILPDGTIFNVRFHIIAHRAYRHFIGFQEHDRTIFRSRERDHHEAPLFSKFGYRTDRSRAPRGLFHAHILPLFGQPIECEAIHSSGA